jgi:hypothetical protein
MSTEEAVAPAADARPATSTLVPNIAGLWIYEDPRVPLTQIEEDGTTTEILCQRGGGAIFVHPERTGRLLSIIATAAARDELPVLMRKHAVLPTDPRGPSPREKALRVWHDFAVQLGVAEPERTHMELLRDALMYGGR